MPVLKYGPNKWKIGNKGKDTCKLHGEVTYLFSRIANALICNECVSAGYYHEDITREITENCAAIKCESKNASS